ncbi:MAG: ribonuclease H-like domain-containing protein [Desulfobacterota bacterium]|nr:ribonuclease H-like domain-containing protein [Thermodesulfobacteriota bacterium]MDW8001766.1 ribonuclease H-like domain-containing protein [Deltaproteobacteria bacterium]
MIDYRSMFLALQKRRKIYLDVETDFLGRICVIGIAKENRDFIQFYGEEVLFINVEKPLCTADIIVTFNGDRFDLPLIKKQLRIDLWESHLSLDLCKVKKSMGIKGGLKEVEEFLGIPRKTKGLRGYEIPRLWDRYLRYGDKYALDLILDYNREDVLNLIEVEKRLRYLLEVKDGKTFRDRIDL